MQEWLKGAKALLGGKHITLMVYGYAEYYRADSNARERARKAAVRGETVGAEAGDGVDRYQLEEVNINGAFKLE